MMIRINVTLRLMKRYFESIPNWTNWEQMQINKVEFLVTDTVGQVVTKVDGVIGSSASEFITGAISLEQNREYSVRAVVFSPFHPNGVQSGPLVFNTNDATTYFNFEITVIHRDTRQPIQGATVIFEPQGRNISRLTRHDGLAWIQRIPGGSYPVTVQRTGFVTSNITWNTGVSGTQFVHLAPTP